MFLTFIERLVYESSKICLKKGRKIFTFLEESVSQKLFEFENFQILDTYGFF